MAKADATQTITITNSKKTTKAFKKDAQEMVIELQQLREQEAYRIWQEEGCPPGRHEDHWRRACEKYPG